MQPDDSSPRIGANAPVRVDPTPAIAAAPSARLWALALIGATLAGLVAWAVGEAAQGYFAPTFVRPAGWDQMNPYERSSVYSRQIKLKRPGTESSNAALAFGTLGAALGAALGLAGGLARGSARFALAAGAIGLAAGAAAGAATSHAVGPVFFDHLLPDSGLTLPLLARGAIWSAVAAAAGLALGLGLGDRSKALTAAAGGVLGAILATILVESLGAVAFATIRVDSLVPGHRMARLAAHLGVALLVALGCLLALSDRRRGAA